MELSQPAYFRKVSAREVKAMKVGLLFNLVKATRRIRILLGGYKGMEENHRLFRLFDPKIQSLPIELLAERLRGMGYYYNAVSTTYRRQIYTARKLVGYNHQIHLRFYSDGWVSGHCELRPEVHPLEHLDGVELRPLSEGEIFGIKEQLGGF